MKTKPHQVRIILLDYLTSNSRQDFIRTLRLEYSQKQCEILIGKLDSYATLCHKNSILLSFPYVWDKIKEEAISMTKEEVAELLWNKNYQKSGVSKKHLGQICFSWFVFEKKFFEFTQENQKLLEKSKNKQQNNDLEHEQ